MVKIRIICLAILVALWACSKTHGESIEADDKAVSEDNSSQEVPFFLKLEEVPRFKAALNDNFIGFGFLPVKPVQDLPKLPPSLSPTDLDFYQKYAGIYANKGLIQNGHLNLTMLQQTETTWGSDYYPKSNLFLVDYSQTDTAFVINNGYTKKLIEDTSKFTLERYLTKISGPTSYHELLNFSITQNQDELRKLEIVALDEAKISALTDFSKKALLAIRYLDGKYLKDVISTKYKLSQREEMTHIIAPEQVDAAIEAITRAEPGYNINRLPPADYDLFWYGFDIERILAQKFRIYIDQFVYTSAATFETAYPTAHLVEIVFESDESVALGVLNEGGELKLCFLKNLSNDN